MKAKIISVEELGRISKSLRATGKKLVATNGCFDLLHVGHVRYLQKARELGDALAVGINGDSSVEALKGKGRPFNDEEDRAEIIASLECVDYVTIFPEKRATDFLGAIQPAIYVKGGDYRADTLNADERAVLEKIGARIQIVSLEPGYSTSDLVERLRKSCAA